METDGRLPTGQPLDEAIRDIDAATGGSPAYYMINCAHPSHFSAIRDDADYAALRGRFPWNNVLGGCCGSDHRHIEQICTSCREAA